MWDLGCCVNGGAAGKASGQQQNDDARLTDCGVLVLGLYDVRLVKDEWPGDKQQTYEHCERIGARPLPACGLMQHHHEDATDQPRSQMYEQHGERPGHDQCDEQY